MRGILFKPDIVRAIVQGRKTQTRRLSGLDEVNSDASAWKLLQWERLYTEDFSRGAVLLEGKNGFQIVCKPRFRVGKVAYVQEVWRPASEKEVRIEYKSDGAVVEYPEKPSFYFYGCGDRWRSPRFMPAWAARTFIRIEAVRPERLQEITEADAVAEGIIWSWSETAPGSNKYEPCATENFPRLWDSINPKHPWAGNWWVWVYTFEKVVKPCVS